MNCQEILKLANSISEQFGVKIDNIQYRQKSSDLSIRQFENAINLSLSQNLCKKDDNKIEALLYIGFARFTQQTNLPKYKYFLNLMKTLPSAENIADMKPKSINNCKGVYFDLNILLKDVQDQYNHIFHSYFDNYQPYVQWSKKKTFRKFGYYDLTHHSITISKSLDNKVVPDYVLKYLIYHEILHGYLGTNVVNGRQYAHHKKFHELEQLHTDFLRANAFLEQFSHLIKINKK